MAQGPAKKTQFPVEHHDLDGLADDDHSFYPKGVLGYTEVTSDSTGYTGAATDITGMSVTVTAAANRVLRISGHLGQVTSKTTGIAIVRIQEGATDLSRMAQHNLSADERMVAVGFAIIEPSSGSHTYKLTMAVGGGGEMDVLANSDRPNWILVEDIGPA